jgi:hypothetical protein
VYLGRETFANHFAISSDARDDDGHEKGEREE